MHQLIIAEASGGEKTGRCSLRLIGNAAGPLLPSLATSLKSTFWCVYANPSLQYPLGPWRGQYSVYHELILAPLQYDLYLEGLYSQQEFSL